MNIKNFLHTIKYWSFFDLFFSVSHMGFTRDSSWLGHAPWTWKYRVGFINKRVITKAYFFVTQPTRKHWVFPLTEVLAYKVPAILKKFVSKEVGTSLLWNCAWQPGRVYVMSFRLTRNQARRRKTDLASFTRSAKCIFFNRLSTSVSLLLSFFGVWSTFSSEWYSSKAVIT